MQASYVSAADLESELSKQERHVVRSEETEGSETKRKREKVVRQKIVRWRDTQEYARLGTAAREMVEKSMLSKGLKHSDTYYFLNNLAVKADILCSSADERIPFF